MEPEGSLLCSQQPIMFPVLSQVKQSTFPNPMSLRYSLILHSHLGLSLGLTLVPKFVGSNPARTMNV
jgi:hypothetical protein